MYIKFIFIVVILITSNVACTTSLYMLEINKVQTTGNQDEPIYRIDKITTEDNRETMSKNNVCCISYHFHRHKNNTVNLLLFYPLISNGTLMLTCFSVGFKGNSFHCAIHSPDVGYLLNNTQYRLCKSCRYFFNKNGKTRNFYFLRVLTTQFQQLSRSVNKHYAGEKFKQRKLLSSEEGKEESYDQFVKLTNVEINNNNKAIGGTEHDMKSAMDSKHLNDTKIVLNPGLRHTATNMTEFVKLVELLKKEISKDPLWAMLSVVFLLVLMACANILYFSSKDPLWAMFSVIFLLVLMVCAMWCCGMRCINRSTEIHIDITDEFHFVNIADVIRLKKPYLPKTFLTFRKKMRRKFKKRRKTFKAMDIEDPVLDNSDEDKLLYTRDFDF